MYSFLAFLITVAELIIIVSGWALHAQNLLYTALIYGSPFYLLMTMFRDDAALFDLHNFFLYLLVFHILKYFIMFRAQRVDDNTRLLYTAIFFEIVYLGLSAYYVNTV